MSGYRGDVGEARGRGGVGRAIDRYGELPDDERVALLDDLAARSATGDTIALDGLLAVVDGHQLTRTAIRRLIVQDRDAEDVHQDVLIRVAERIDGFQGSSRFTTWLHTVSRNAAIDHLRRQRPTEQLPDIDGPVSDARRVSSLISSQADIRAVFDGLPDHYREIVTLRDVEGLSYEAIANQLDLPLNTVRSRLARGRALVAKRLGQP